MRRNTFVYTHFRLFVNNSDLAVALLPRFALRKTSTMRSSTWDGIATLPANFTCARVLRFSVKRPIMPIWLTMGLAHSRSARFSPSSTIFTHKLSILRSVRTSSSALTALVTSMARSSALGSDGVFALRGVDRGARGLRHLLSVVGFSPQVGHGVSISLAQIVVILSCFVMSRRGRPLSGRRAASAGACACICTGRRGAPWQRR